MKIIKSNTLTAFLGILMLSLAATAGSKPNILWIMSDDHATEGIGAYGGRFAGLDPTPTLDKLAREGALFTNAFCTNSICTPSRATLMTGQYSHTNGVTTLFEALPPEQQYLPKWIKSLGYETAMVGKWHLKEEPAPYDYYAVLEGQGWYFNPRFRVRGPKPWPQNEFTFPGYDCVHSSDAITRLSLDWLKKRKGDKPFFLMHHFKAPHDNFENAERYDWLYEDEFMPEPESLWDRANHGPDGGELYGTSIGKRNERRNMGHHMFVDESLSDKEYKRVAYQRYMKKYLRTVRGLDDGIAKLVSYLEKTGELDNTIILYTSDQGFMLGEHDYIDKRWMYEESLRQPFIVRYPKMVKPGTVIDTVVNNTDYAPTLVELAGGKAPADVVEGRSFVNLLKDKPMNDARESTYYRYWLHMAHHDNPAHFGVRTETHKLIFFYGMGLGHKHVNVPDTEPYWEMYDISKDPKEQNNIFNNPEHKQVRKALLKELIALREETGDTDDQYPELKKLFEEEARKIME